MIIEKNIIMTANLHWHDLFPVEKSDKLPKYALF